MATREKTVTFAVPMATSLVADATVTNLDQITLHIPEASPTFTSVFVELGFQDVITATGGTITEHRVGLRLGAAGYTTITETDDITHSGENMAGVVGPFDFTSHFAANWTGTSMTCDLQVYFDQTTGTPQGMANVTAVVHVTFTYDDTAATQVKTVRIPLESLVGALPTTLTDFGTNQIPQLTGAGGILPEASATIRDWFIVIEGNENNINTTDFTLSTSIDGGAETAFMGQEAALSTDRFCRWIYKPSAPDPTAAHSFELASTAVNKCNHVTATLVVTYTFDLAGTSRLLNSIMLPIEIASPLGLTTAAEASRFKRSISVQEPGTIALRQSAFRINYNVPSTVTSHRWRAGEQDYRAYTSLAGQVAGMFSVQQRIDGGSAQGAGMTLARGMNDLVIDGYTINGSSEMTNISGYVLLNYESDVPSTGVGAASHTVQKVLLPWNAQLSDLNRNNNQSFSIPEDDYWIIGAGFCFIQWATTNMALTFDVECLSGEGKGGGYYDIYADAYATDAERACSIVWMRGRDTFKRHPTDTDPDRLDIGTARDYRLYTSTTTANGMLFSVTYHSNLFIVAGNISGNDPDLPSQVRLIYDATGEVRDETTLAAGETAFSFTVHDNTEEYYVSVFQDAAHVGRSGKGVAT